MSGDPRSYFLIEAREIADGLTRGALALERTGRLEADGRRHLLRLAHTLKGAARVVREPAIADTAHAIEDLVAAAPEVPDASLASQLLGLVDTIIRGLGPAAAPAPADAAEVESASVRATPDEAVRNLRIELTAVDALLERVSVIGARCAAVQEQLVSADQELPAPVRRAVDSLDALAHDIAQLRSDLRHMRLAPASLLFVPLERAVRDAALSAGVAARVETAGGDLRLDADVLAMVRDALIQAVRNAVAHGLEPAPQRIAAGKPAEGTIRLAVERRGTRVAFVCQDDGRGIDAASVRRAAADAGMVGRERAETMSHEELVQLLLGGGVSSRRSVSQLAGRGVGLDLVRSIAARLNGSVSMSSTAGAGVTLELVVPVSVRSLTCLSLQSAAGEALLPLDAITRVSRLSDVIQDGGLAHVVADGHLVPFVSLAAVLGGADPVRRDRVAVIVSAEGRVLALGTARPGEVMTTIIQALPPLSPATSVVRAVAVDEQGRIVPVLEPAELFAFHGAARPPAGPALAGSRILVVDDSITTRMLEQSILAVAGYDVDAVASGEEALARAASQSYDLFIVDVEMPGMDGFEFLARIRSNRALRDVPAMLVTSRSMPADRARGAAAGAQAYIVKGEFDQEVFLRTIRGLLG